MDQSSSEVEHLDVLLVLAVYGVDLAFGGALGEHWRDEELREAVERRREVRRRDVEVKVGELGRRERVGRAAVLVDELVVRVLLRVLLGAQEQHVLQEVRQTRKLARIGHRTCASTANETQ